MNLLAAFLLALATSTSLRASPIRDLQRELKLDDSKWKVASESDTSLSWITADGLGVTLTIHPVPDPTFPGPDDPKKLHDVYRAEARSYHGDLVEAEPRQANGVFFNLVTMKFPFGLFRTPPDNDPGFAYQMNAVLPTSEGRYVLQVAAAEKGITGIREATGIIIYMREKKIADLAEAGKSFHKDPYDPAFDQGALYAVADERRFDEGLPNHPLSQCRKEMDLLLKSWTISERIRGIAQFKAPEKTGRKKRR